MSLCIDVRDYIVILDCEINALPYQLSSCKALCRQVTERGGKGNAENTSPTQQRHRICDLRPKLTLHSVGLLSKGRERASERTKATNFLPRRLPSSLLHAGKRARVIYTRAGGGFAEPHFERRRRGVFPGLRARMQSTSKLYISPIIFHFFRLSAPPQNSSDPARRLQEASRVLLGKTRGLLLITSSLRGKLKECSEN